MARTVFSARMSVGGNRREIKVTANEADRVLLDAVSRDDVAAVQQAIRTGANVNAIYRGCTTPLLEACELGFDKVFRILLDAGADPLWTCECCDGLSPAAIACHNGHLSIIEILVNHDKSFLGISYGESLLFYAIRGERVDVVQLLINRGANVHATDADC